MEEFKLPAPRTNKQFSAYLEIAALCADVLEEQINLIGKHLKQNEQSKKATNLGY
jgi:hypothetical protein